MPRWDRRHARVALVDAAKRRRGGLPALRPRLDAVVALALPARSVAELAPGVRAPVDLRDPTQRHAWWQGSGYEQPTVDVLTTMCRGAERFFDVGANLGLFTWWLVVRCPELRATAFEPNPALADALRRIAVANGLERVDVVGAGLADAAGELVLHLGRDDEGHTTFGPHPTFGADAGPRVPVTSFDAWRAGVGLELPPAPAWVAKLDVEGYELLALQGMAEALDAHAFAGLVVELNDYTLAFCGTSAAEVDGYLASRGYRRLEDSPGGAGCDTGSTFNAFYLPEGAAWPGS